MIKQVALKQINGGSAIVIGSTGSVGRRVVHHLLKGNQYSRVTAIVRKSQDPSIWLTEEKRREEKISEEMKERMKSKLTQIEFDFDSLNDTSSSSDLSDIWNGHTAGFTCLGLYTGVDEKEWERIEYGYNVKIAQLLKDRGTERFHYLSGQSVVEGGDSMFAFARIKGKTELALKQIGFENFSTFRPGGIYERPVERQVYMFEPLLNSAMSIFGTVLGSTCDDIAKSMVLTSLMEEPSQIIENDQIKRLSAVYDNQLNNI
eukprot:TRINITY_DN7534_c0_g1_i2.p2 TRINITY_DN7534_c0_g1~~TRINITY_DN7534_c0_g1_i2.p2  ORF type:complete len:260 (+),score=60.07 TRINITY_DN7534_c0_g1_i2:64-843(+)